MTGRRIRRVVISGKLVAEVLTVGHLVERARVSAGLPEGALLVSAAQVQPAREPGGHCDLQLIFEHDSFEPWYPQSGAAPTHPPCVFDVEPSEPSA